MAERSKFEPLWFDACRNHPESNKLIPRLIHGDISIMELFQCDPALFEEVKQEVLAIQASTEGEEVGGDHPTYKFVARVDPSWKPKPGSIHQHSLYNSKDNFLYFNDDHHWTPVRRAFNSNLVAIPKFFKKYFGESEMQNARLQSIAGGGDLGQHREKIVSIPGREQNWKVRFHLPIVTNPNVGFLMDGKKFTMQAGHCYIFNQSCLHGVANTGSELRTHMYWDYYLNDHIMLNLIGPAFEKYGSQN
jgi:hypothetical protein